MPIRHLMTLPVTLGVISKTSRFVRWDIGKGKHYAGPSSMVSVNTTLVQCIVFAGYDPALF